MSFVVVVAVALLAFFYVRMNRQARRAWLQKIDLAGQWYGQGSDTKEVAQLTLHGGLDSGDFTYKKGDSLRQGRWRLTGHTLTLSGDGFEQVFDLHYFKAGHIGLEETDGTRHLFNKSADNVVPLNVGRES